MHDIKNMVHDLTQIRRAGGIMCSVAGTIFRGGLLEGGGGKDKILFYSFLLIKPYLLSFACICPFF